MAGTTIGNNTELPFAAEGDEDDEDEGISPWLRSNMAVGQWILQPSHPNKNDIEETSPAVGILTLAAIYSRYIPYHCWLLFPMIHH